MPLARPLARLRSLRRHHPVALAIFTLALVISCAFALRLVLFTLHWSDPANRALRPEAWMTPGFIAHSWHLPQQEVLDLLTLDTLPERRTTLEDIARARGQPVQSLLDTLARDLAAQGPR